jgi:predicted AlkP superfamily pyrophosphatase or phosphodiesterase
MFQEQTLRNLRRPLPLCKRTAATLLLMFLIAPPAINAQASRNAAKRAKAAISKSAASVPPSAYNARPKLAIILVIDQFREDYLERYRADFKGRGFNLFLNQGAYFPDCYYDYANTKTAPGHSTIGTGAYSDGHGIANNDWWDLSRNTKRPISSVEDERYALVGVPPTGKATPGSSPRNLRASTVGDELRLATQGQAKLFGISLKDRASILPAGATANAAYWLDAPSGNFITSTYYMGQLPAWANAFNGSGRAAQAAQEAAVFANKWQLKESTYGGKNFYGFVGSTPAANSYELDFARALITSEQLGHHPVTDMLTISLSANDILGHAVGPDSPAQHAMIDALDVDLASFFDWLDTHIDGGLGNVWIALTADHGIAPVPADAAKLGINSATINLKALMASLNEAMNAKYSPGKTVNYLFDSQELPILSLDQPSFEQAGIKEHDAEQAVLDALPAAANSLAAAPDASLPPQSRMPPTPRLLRSYSREQLAAGAYPADEFGGLLGHSYSSNGGWYVMLVFAGYQMQANSSGGTTHFSPWSYDRHVPLGFYGAPFAPGIYHGRVGPVDLAATWAALLGINQPSASVGHILTQAIKPSAAVTYPASGMATNLGAPSYAAPSRRAGGSNPTASTPSTSVNPERGLAAAPPGPVIKP